MSEADNKLYDEVKSLFSISDRAYNTFFTIKDRQRFCNENSDVLIIYKDKKELIKNLKRLQEQGLYVDIERQYVKSKYSERYLRLKTINQCKTLDGYRFKDVIFK